MHDALAAVAFPRRHWLATAAAGFGAVAFKALAAEDAAGTTRPPHFPARAKRVVFLCMDGGPSHVDSFDHKPALVRHAGEAIGRGRVPTATLLAPLWEFRRRGASGLWISDLFPEIAGHADKLCLVNSMRTDVPNHPPAFLQMHTGVSTAVRPSLGAWVSYGLGSENANLPGFVTISPPPANGGPANYGSAFLPASHQATKIGGAGGRFARFGGDEEGVSNIANPRLSRQEQRSQVDFIQSLNRRAADVTGEAAAVEGLIAAHEMAFRMQDTLPDALDVTAESPATAALYGLGDETSADFARQCLMARRLLERGVRFVEVCHGGWDQHRALRADHGRHARAVDRPIAGLLADLDARGMLADTLVVWGGEFGRTPYGQTTDGRDHNHQGFTTWFAGGGVKAGHVHGATDEFGMEAVESPVHVHDWHATILHLLGLDHTRLTFRHAGRDMRLTDTAGRVVEEIVA
jgi:hypothetical protein